MNFDRAAIAAFRRTLRECDESWAADEALLYLDVCLAKIDRLTAEKEQAEAEVRRLREAPATPRHLTRLLLRAGRRGGKTLALEGRDWGET